MDALSHLLTLCPGEMLLDVRCRLSGSYAIPHEQLPAGQAAFHLVLSGRCRLRTADGKFDELVPGSFVLLPQGQAHAVLDPLSSNETSSSVVVLDESTPQTLPVKRNDLSDQASRHDELDLLCGRLLYAHDVGTLFMCRLPPLIHVNLADSPGIAALDTLTQLLRSEVSKSEPGARTIANALVQTLMTYALRAYGQRAPLQTTWLTLASHKRLSRSVHAMLDEPQRAWTLEELGKLSALSRASYARIFKEASGLTPGEALKSIRLMHACKLIQQTRRNIADIAQSVGYQSEAAFAKVFRTRLGLTPGQWRKSRLGQARGSDV